MQDYEIDAYLGDTDTTPEQYDAIRRAADQVERRWPDADDADERREALTAAVQVILGDATVQEIGQAGAEAQGALIRARAAQAGAAIAAAGDYPSEQALADDLQVTRMTVRSWLGK